MQRFLLDFLECPACHGSLSWHIIERDGNHIETGSARCQLCQTSYPIRDGIGLFLLPDARGEDLWEEAATGIGRFLAGNPSIDAQLTGGPLNNLAPADQLFRGIVLSERGDAAGGEAAHHAALPHLYTSEYLECYAAVRRHLITQLMPTNDTIFDLASGRGDLADQLLTSLDNDLVMTDISPRILRLDRQRLLALGGYSRVSLLAFDAKRTPFRNGVIRILTTNFGLGNMRDAARLLTELRRIVSGTFFAVTYFYPEDDAANRITLDTLGLEELAFQQGALDRFVAAGWRPAVESECTGRAEPTPKGVLLEGVSVDGLPSAPTILKWGLLRAN